METDSKIYLFFLAVYLVLVTGCAASVSATSPKKVSTQQDDITNKKVITQQGDITNPTNNPVELAVLSEIPTLNTDAKGTVGNVTFIAGEAFAAASGLRCRPVTITENSPAGSIRGRMVCKNGQNWFFSKDVFLMEPVSD